MATAATALGLRSGVSALLGDDLGSRVAQEHCRRCGIVLTPSAYVTGRAAGITVVLNFHGDRAFISYVPPRPARERPHHSRWAEILRTHRPAWCYLHAGPRAVAAVREARSLGVHVALDVARGSRAALSLAPWTGADMPGSIASTLK